ncbi:hypothetical protein [Saliphagus sp. LR7]|uniref:hypothetical protein n=1 Tax=Saliphagus sp. LR7 TaxID=2282654 RepID=UPI000DF81809|nr:hypothetical protein [Saliphagus sp. LR7]
MERPLGLASFDRQRRSVHALTVAVAVVVFWFGYFGSVAAVYGTVSVLAPEASIAEQRVGGIVGSVFVWTYFALAFVRGYGGPVLDAVVYPFAIVALAPFSGRWLLFGPDISGLFSRFVGWVVVEPLLTTLLAVVPGIGTFVAVLSIWGAAIGDADRRDWERRHLPAEFYDEFVARDRDGEE